MPIARLDHVWVSAAGRVLAVPGVHVCPKTGRPLHAGMPPDDRAIGQPEEAPGSRLGQSLWTAHIQFSDSET
jgi:hypothetical protein